VYPVFDFTLLIAAAAISFPHAFDVDFSFALIWVLCGLIFVKKLNLDPSQ
jgi:hypothetical protein